MYAFCIFIDNDLSDQLLVNDCLSWIGHPSPELTTNCYRVWHQLLRATVPIPEGHQTNVACALIIYSRLNYRWDSHRWLPIFWGCSNPALEGNWPITWIYLLTRVEPFWLQIYNWSTAWPIKILEKNTSLWI